MRGFRVHRPLRLLALLAWAIGAVASVMAQDDPGDERARKAALHLHEQALRFALRSEGETSAAQARALSAFLLATRRPSSPAQRSIELLADHQQAFAADGGASAWPALDELWWRLEGPTVAPSTAEVLLEQLVEATYRSLATKSMSCCLCSNVSTCDDGLFCNGAEVCNVDHVCTAGAAPCSDGDSCTYDSCYEGTGECFFDPVPPPDEVASLWIDRDAMQPAVAVLGWNPVAGADTYNVYRGAITDLSDLGCFAPNLPQTAASDPGIPSGMFLYLVSSLGCGESGIGNGTWGPRPAPPVCP